MDLTKRRERLLMKILEAGPQGRKIHKATETDHTEEDARFMHEKGVVFMGNFGLHLRAVHSSYLKDFYNFHFIGKKITNLHTKITKAQAAQRLGLTLADSEMEPALTEELSKLKQQVLMERKTLEA